MISVDKVKLFFDEFILVPLQNLDDPDKKLSSFSSAIRQNTLDSYLKNEAINDDKQGKTKVYVIFEPQFQKIVCFFSLKCGAVYETDEVDDARRMLSTDELKLLKDLEDIRSNHPEIYSDAAKVYTETHEKGAMLVKIVDQQVARNMDETVSDCIQHVKEVYPSIEIQHF